MVNLGDVFPNFKANTTIGPIQFHDFLGEKWGILFSHPSDFTPVCTTELARVANLMSEFEKRNVKVIALSCDTVDSHQKWIQILRAIDSLQLTEKNKVATPADWKSGSECMVLPTLKEEEATALFPKGFTVMNLPSGKPYLRITPQP
ncbi:Peroxiredoxin-6 [Blattella germanica]|nr:Peroxiredoxin-6 [Blattella germanica]